MRGLAAITITACALAACGSRSQLIAPPESPPVPLPDPSVQLALGNDHSCLLRESGTVTCWGRGPYGQLGAGDAALTGIHRVRDLDDAVQIAATAESTCALRRNGSVVCWGANQYGQLGTMSIGEHSHAPFTVPGLPRMASITTGNSFSCGLARDRAVWCWGSIDGLVERARSDAGVRRVDAMTLDGFARAVAVSAANGQPWGASDVCALDEDGVAWCVGGNGGGRLGIGLDHAQLASTLVPSAVDTSVVFAGVATGGEHACALDETNHAWCWGVNGDGRLGDGSVANRSRPSEVTSLDAVAQIAPGGYHTCARLTSGGVYCWGSNDAGQLGRGSIAAWGTPHPTPERVSGLDYVVALATGQKHSCAVESDGSVWCWGRGALLDASGAAMDSGTPVRIAVD